MILTDVKKYLQQRGQASLGDIALHCDADPDAIRGMLETWIRKGRVAKSGATASCGTSCQACDPASTEIYSWVESEIRVAAPLPGHCKH